MASGREHLQSILSTLAWMQNQPDDTLEKAQPILAEIDDRLDDVTHAMNPEG